MRSTARCWRRWEYFCNNKMPEARFSLAIMAALWAALNFTRMGRAMRASAERLFSRARFEMGVDVNGRFNVRATDTVTNYGLDGSVASQVFSVMEHTELVTLAKRFQYARMLDMLDAMELQ